MKKPIAFLLVLILLLLPACQLKGGTGTGGSGAAEGERRALWVSYYEYPDPTGLTRDGYYEKADALFAAAESMGFNIVFLHVRAFADAFYSSELFPLSEYLTGTEGGTLDFDPLAVMLEAAGHHGIEVDAWVNPFRVSYKTDITALSAENPARVMYEAGNSEDAVYIGEEGIYFNPACETAQKLVLDGMQEILENYEVGGIHIDDYFYPTTEQSIDALQYQAYVDAGGKSALGDWRRDTVSAFVASAYQTVKHYGQNMQFTVSPAADIDNNYETLYADVAKWLAEPGYADAVIPQIYFGFEHSTMPFADVAARWAALPRHESAVLLCGLGAYRYQEATEGEWKENTDVLTRQIAHLRSTGGYNGFAVFSLSSLTEDDSELSPAGLEVQNSVQ